MALRCGSQLGGHVLLRWKENLQAALGLREKTFHRLWENVQFEEEAIIPSSIKLIEQDQNVAIQVENDFFSYGMRILM